MDSIIVSDDQARVILSTEDVLPIKDCFGHVIGHVYSPPSQEAIEHLTQHIQELRERNRCEN